MEKLFGDRKIDLNLPETRKDLVTAMPKRTQGFSISGVQMKCQMAIEENRLKLVDSGGVFIMKPSPEEYPHVAENEHATLTLMSRVGFEVPPCGLLMLKDGHLVFIIRRYDRTSDGARIHQEDAMQALGIDNTEASQKYNSASYQEVLELVIKHAGIAVAMELLLRLVFSYLVGNDDHHLKNISFFHHPVFKLTPCYDVLASDLYSSAAESPMALRMLREGDPQYFQEMGNGFYGGCDFVELGEKAGLPKAAVLKRINTLVEKVQVHAPKVIEGSYMPDEMKSQYQSLLSSRLKFMDVM